VKCVCVLGGGGGGGIKQNHTKNFYLSMFLV
jgi:hypothetical protein